MRNTKVHTLSILLCFIHIAHHTHGALTTSATPPSGNSVYRTLTRFISPLDYLDEAQLPNVAINALEKAKRDLSKKINFTALKCELERSIRFADATIGYFWSYFTPNSTDQENRVITLSIYYMCPLLRQLLSAAASTQPRDPHQAINQYQKSSLYEIFLNKPLARNEWKQAEIPAPRGSLHFIHKQSSYFDFIAEPNNIGFYNWIHQAINQGSFRTEQDIEQITQFGSRLAERSWKAHNTLLNNIILCVNGSQSGWIFSAERPKRLEVLYKVLYMNTPNISIPIGLIFTKALVDLKMKELHNKTAQLISEQQKLAHKQILNQCKREQGILVEKMEALIQLIKQQSQQLQRGISGDAIDDGAIEHDLP